jgi:septal ring factor EnvC (AmiA/AmiB activator)
MTEQEHSEDIADLKAEIERLEEDTKRLTRSYNIACYNIAELSEQKTELNSQKKMLGEALNTATLLLDEMLTEMRLANVTPSAKMIYSKAQFDQAMKKLLSYVPKSPAERPDAYRDDPAGETPA